MKRLLKLVIALVVVLLLGAVAIVFYIDAIAKRGVERGATHALGVKTTLDSADVGIFGSKFSMAKLRSDNPEGFDSDHFMTLREGDTAVTLGSLLEETVELPHLNLTGVDLNLERKTGKSNYDVVLESLRKFESQPREGAKKFTIKKVTIRDVNVHVQLLPLPGELGEATKVDLPIDEIVLEDVGSGTKRGVLISELVGVLFKAILAAVADKGAIPADLANDLKAQLAKLQSIDALADIESLGKTIDDALGTDITEKAKEGIDKTLGGIKDVLGDDKDK